MIITPMSRINVDLPGCPPVSGNIIGLISSLLGSVDANIDTEKCMCDVCPLETCLLKEVKLCFRPITAVGENYDMLKMGYPILGEFGLTKAVHAEYAMKLLNKLTANPLNKKFTNRRSITSIIKRARCSWIFRWTQRYDSSNKIGAR